MEIYTTLLVLFSTQIISALLTTSSANEFNPENTMVLVQSGQLISNGVIVTNRGHIVTTSHGLVQDKTTTITYKGKNYPVVIVYHSSNQDLAIVKAESDHAWMFSPISETPNAKSRVTIHTLRRTKNNFLKKQKITSKVVVSNMNMYPSTWLESDFRVQEHKQRNEYVVKGGFILSHQFKHGDSGSGVYSTDNQLVGIVSRTSKKQSSKLSWALGLSAIQYILNEENAGLFNENEQRINWFADGMQQALLDFGISKSDASKWRQSTLENASLYSNAKIAFDFIFRQFQQGINNNKKSKIQQ